MKITSAEFVKSAFELRHWPTGDLPEIAFLGRSNVGKSSLINSLLGRKGLARTSNTPGRTQSINFFLINESLFFADLPGYGFAKVSKTMRADWGRMAEEYLNERDELALCIQLIDARHKPTALDMQLNEWLIHNGRPHIAVATKSDKLSKNEMARSLAETKSLLPETEIIAYSSHTGRGRDELWSAIADAVNKKATFGLI